MSMRRCIIFAGGPENGTLCRPLPEDALILCADSGLHLAERLGVYPDLVLGDFDSLGAVPADYPHMTVPVEKDDTDTLLACRVALERGCDDITVAGAFGGRLDHVFANLQTLEFLAGHGATGRLIGANDFAELLTPGRYAYPAAEGFSLSLFSWTERCGGVTARGVYYPLEHAELTRDFPLGVSNSVTAERAEIELEEGLLLVIGSRL